MKSFMKVCALILLLAGLRFASDVESAVRFMNRLLPFPVLGSLYLLLLAVLLYDLVLAPLIAYARLPRVKRGGNTDVLGLSRMIMRQLERSGKEPGLKEQFRDALQIQDTEKLCALVDSYYGGLDGDTARIIRNYSMNTALCVVASRNPLLDAVAMFVGQYRLSLELMRLYGFKPSPVFNFLSLFWIAGSSAANGIFGQATADGAGEIFEEFLCGSVLEDGVVSDVLSKLGAFAVEAMTAATTVYVTGWVVNRKLKGESASIPVRELFKMRKEARRELFGSFTGSLKTKLGNIQLSG